MLAVSPIGDFKKPKRKTYQKLMRPRSARPPVLKKEHIYTDVHILFWGNNLSE